MEFAPFFVTLKLIVGTVGILGIIGVPIAYWVAFTKWKKLSLFVEALLMMPIVLPPTVLGFYIIVLLGPKTSVGSAVKNLVGVDILFSFTGILVGSVVFCLPFMLSPLVAGFRNIRSQYLDVLKILGKSKMDALVNVLLPLIKVNLVSALLLTIAHCIGEFGVVLMIGGGVTSTTVASIAIYEELMKLNYEAAHWYALVLLGISFTLIFVITLLSRKHHHRLA